MAKVLLLISAFLCATLAQNLHMDVYYESLCPDSRNFLVNQLSPNWPTLSTFTTLRLIPFGKASFTANPAGGWDFQCQHGPDECTGNILHACGIQQSSNTTQALAYATCLMLAPTSGASCAASAGLDFTKVNACATSVTGQNLVQSHGVETLSLKPTLTFVPWVVYNKFWEDGLQWNSLKDVKSVACSQTPSANAPACLRSRAFFVGK